MNEKMIMVAKACGVVLMVATLWGSALVASVGCATASWDDKICPVVPGTQVDSGGAWGDRDVRACACKDVELRWVGDHSGVDIYCDGVKLPFLVRK